MTSGPSAGGDVRRAPCAARSAFRRRSFRRGAVLSPATRSNHRGPSAAPRAALEVMLTDAAIEPGTVGRLAQPDAAVRLAGGPAGTYVTAS
jgi:hypothetical protein